MNALLTNDELRRRVTDRAGRADWARPCWPELAGGPLARLLAGVPSVAVGLVSGGPASGKTAVSLLAAAQAAVSGQGAVVIANESGAPTVRERLRRQLAELGAPEAERMVHVTGAPQVTSALGALDSLPWKPRLLVVESLDLLPVESDQRIVVAQRQMLRELRAVAWQRQLTAIAAVGATTSLLDGTSGPRNSLLAECTWALDTARRASTGTPGTQINRVALSTRKGARATGRRAATIELDQGVVLNPAS